MITESMGQIRATLAKRLTAKGIKNNEIDLFVKDVVRVVTHTPASNLEAIKGRLHVLGWQSDYADYGTIQLIQACYQDE